MNIKKIVSLAIAGALFFSLPVMAADNETEQESGTWEEVIVFCEESDIDLADFESVGHIQLTDLTLNADMSVLDEILMHNDAVDLPVAYSLSADVYEPNDTPATAYNYDIIPEMEGYMYVNGFKNANLHTVTDEDWYYTTLIAGNIYFLDLRNIGTTPGFNISIFHFNDDNTMDYVTSVGDDRFTGRPEKYYYFQPDKSGTYYVCVTGDGINVSDGMNYFFYIGSVERSFTYSKGIGSVLIRGDEFQAGKRIDLTQDVVPDKSIVLSMSFSNAFSGRTCTECEKKIVAIDGKSYYSSSVGGTEILDISNYQYVDQIWSLSARCASNSHVTTWMPWMTIRYSCIMQPYPGNEVY